MSLLQNVNFTSIFIQDNILRLKHNMVQYYGKKYFQNIINVYFCALIIYHTSIIFCEFAILSD